MFSFQNKMPWKAQAPAEDNENVDSSVQALLLSAQQERVQLTVALQESRRMIQDLTSALQVCRQSKEPSNSQLRQELRQLKTTMEEKDRYIAGLQSTLRTQPRTTDSTQALQQRLQQLQAEKKQLHEEASALLIQLHDSRQSEKTLMQRVVECQQLETAYKQLQKDLINTRSEAMLLKDEFEKAKSLNAEYSKKLRSLQELDIIKAGAPKLQRVVRPKIPSQMEKDLANVEASQLYVQQTHDKLQACYENMAKLNERFAAVQGQLLEYGGLLNQATANELRLNKLVSEATQKNQTLQEQYTRLLSQLEEKEVQHTQRILELEQIEKTLRNEKTITEKDKASIVEQLRQLEADCAKDGTMMAEVIWAYETFLSNGNLVNQYAQCLQSKSVESCRSIFVKMPDSYATVRDAIKLSVQPVQASKPAQLLSGVGSYKKPYPFVSSNIEDDEEEEE
jgi:hypothetical protein